MLRTFRRQILLAAVACLWLGSGLAQDFPTKPVKVVLPFLAGGSPDALARLLGEGLAKQWNQPVVVENRPGASGTIGAQAVKAAPADGHTLLLAVSSLVQVPHLVPTAPYDPLKDFAPIAHLGGTHLALLVNAGLPVGTVQDFIAYAKARPKKLNFASYGAASLSHMFGEILNDVAGLELTHVAYKGDGPALVDLMENRVETAFLSVFLVRPQVAAGKVKILAVTGQTRSPLVPGVATFEELGIKGLEAQGWFGLLAPAGTPGPVQEKISNDVSRLLRQEDLRTRLLGMGIVAAGSTPAEFARMVRSDYEMYGAIIRKHKMTLN